jgi:hypothetical protein
MAADPSRAVSDDIAADARMKLTCSHGGRLAPSGPDGAQRYVGGETRVLVVPRTVSFRDLAASLSSEMAGGAEVRAVRHRLADAGLDDVVVTVTCDDELAHLCDEYDRLHATRPAVGFRVFVDTAAAPPASGSGVAAHQQHRAAASGGLPPLAPRLRGVKSEQALAGCAQLCRRPPAYPVPLRRVQSAKELARVGGVRPSCDHRGHQCPFFVSQRQDLFAPAPPYMSRSNVSAVSVEAKAKAKAMSRAEPRLQRVQSEQALAGSAQLRRRPLANPVPLLAPVLGPPMPVLRLPASRCVRACASVHVQEELQRRVR